MIDQPQLPPITECTKRRTWRNTQISGLNALSMMLVARIIGVARSTPLRARVAAEQALVAHRIQPAATQRIAPQNPPDGEDESAKYAVLPDRLYRIVRAARG